MRRPGTNKIYQTFEEASTPGGLVRPSRRSTAKRKAPFSLRLSAEEKIRLTAAAGNMTLGAYIKARLFEDLPAVPRQRAPSRFDKALLGKVLAALGRSRLSSNLNQIAHAANIGALPVDDELSADLKGACADVRIMRNALLKALGHRTPRA